MGCDIHMFIEYKKPNANDRWRSFGKEFRLNRNYLMFGILAQVRCVTTFSFEPKGIPEDLAYNAEDEFYLYVSEQESEGNINPENAAIWIENYKRLKTVYRDGKLIYIQSTDNHTPSSLTLEEYAEAMSEYDKVKHWDEPEYLAILSAMQKLSEFKNQVRIVFWFDN